MLKDNIEHKIYEILSNDKRITFAYIFGSFVHRQQYRDIDIGIYSEPQLELLEIGKLTSKLNDVLSTEVDLTQLNKLPDKNPEFAYQIVTEGELILNRKPELHTHFKKNAFLYYFDTEYLREQINRAFRKRLNSDQFGDRNYA